MSSSMFYDATPGGFEKAKDLRSRETLEERLLWEILKENQLLGFRFKRQHPIANYIVDFYCHEAKLVIEIDGDSHKDQVEYDNNRTAVMNELGVKVIRFTHNEIVSNINSVKEKIIAEMPTIRRTKVGRRL